MRWFAILLLLPVTAGLQADVSGCACDPAVPSTMEARACSLCREAEKQPANVEYFFLKDNNPSKPNRWLILPREHGPGGHPLSDLPKPLQTRLWKAAIAKARELWGEDWGLAYNGPQVRTQCHGHIHIGKILKGLAQGKYIDVDTPDQIPIPADSGIWLHQAGNKIRVHLGEITTETALLR